MGQDFYQQAIYPYAAIIIKICRAYTHTQADFEDYYQEVCLQIWRSRDQFKQQCQWSTWIYKIAINVCLTFLKKVKQQGQYFASDPLPEQLVEDSKSQCHEDIDRLYLAIKQLSETDRGIILLYLDERPQQEIAEIMGTNVNNIGVKISRIKSRLNQLLNIEEN